MNTIPLSSVTGITYLFLLFTTALVVAVNTLWHIFCQVMISSDFVYIYSMPLNYIICEKIKKSRINGKIKRNKQHAPYLNPNG